MGILQTLQDEMKIAMKARDQARLDALRLIVSSLKYAEVDTPNMSDEQIVVVLQKEAKKRREAAQAYSEAGRTEAAEKEQYELHLIEAYLPKMLSEDDVRAKVAEVLASKSFDNFGAAMSASMGAPKGQADGGVVSRIVKELFSA
jgi:uncharacterized protein YqeY